MAKLFDKITGTSTSYSATGITDSSANFVINYYKDWTINIAGTEYLITGNTQTTLNFTNSLSANVDYSIEFVGRTFLTKTESDCSNTTKIPNTLLQKKYDLVNSDIHNKVFSYLKSLYKQDFDPLTNILNLTVLQQVFAYLFLAKIYQDLMIDQESFEGFKGYNMYNKDFIDNIKDALSLLQIDFNEDGEANLGEQISNGSTSIFMSR